MKQGTTLVLGASLKPQRYSNIAVKRLRAQGVEVKAIGLRAGVIEDVRIDTALLPYEGIDTVSLYLGPANQKDYYDYILSLKPKRIIFNPGTENEEFFSLLKEQNIDFEVACTLVMLSTGQY